MGKARVAPLKPPSIPRLELAAATVSARMSQFLRAELKIPCEEFFWTDSQITLGYISNDTKRFHVYVARKVAAIREATKPSQWKHIPTDENPADEASRGLTTLQLLKDSKWLIGPEVLWRPEQVIPDTAIRFLDGNDPELKASAHVHVASKRAFKARETFSASDILRALTSEMEKAAWLLTCQL
jgi:hypothetical protein